MRREFPVGPHDDGRLLEPQGRDPVHHRRDPQARGFPPGTLSWVLSLGRRARAPRKWEKMPDVCFHMIYPSLTAISLKSSHRLGR